MTTKQLSIKVTLSDQASANARALTRLVVDLGRKALAATKSLMSPVTGLIKSLFSLKGVIAGAFAVFAGGAAFQSIRRAAEEMDELVKTSRQLGLSAQFLSELKYAADLSGVAFEGLSSSAAKAARNIDEALRTGRGDAAEAFRELGVQLRGMDGNARPFKEVLLDLSDALNNVDSSYRQVAYSQAIFGKGGTEMLRLFALGRPAIEAMAEEARRLGVVFSDEQLANAEAFNDALSRIGKAWLGIRANIIGQVGDEIADVMNRIASALAAVPEIVGNIARMLRESFDVNSPEGQRVLDAIAGLGQGIIGVINSVGYASIAVVAGAIVDGSKVLLSIVDDVAIGIGKQWVASFGETLAKGWDLVGASSLAQLTRDGVESVKEMFSDETLQGSFRESFIGAMADATAGTEALALGIDHISGQVLQLGRDADALFGISEALARTSLEAIKLPPTLREIDAELEDLKTGMSGFREGWVSAMEEIREMSENTFRLAGDLARALTVDISRDLGSALANAATGAKNFGDAMLDALRNILHGIAETVAQFLVLRAIMGIGGSIFGATTVAAIPPVNTGLSGMSGVAAGGGSIDWGSIFGSGGLPSGFIVPGMAHGSSRVLVPGYSSGISSVPGAYTNRDSTLAMLARDEAVLTPRAADTLGRGTIDHLNRGGSLGGGGISVVINAPITVQAAPGTDGAQVGRDIGRNIAGELLKELSRNPSVRSQLRNVIG